MNAIITLKNNQHELELPLDASYSTFNGNQQLYVVYQDLKYSFLLTLKEVYDEITHLELYINDTQQLIQWTRVSENEYSIQIDTYPFYMIYGVTEVYLLIEFSSGYRKYLFSPYLVVAINSNYKETMTSIYEMLNDIYKKEHALLHQGKLMSSEVSNALKSISHDKYAEEIVELKNIIQVYHDNIPYFMRNAQFISKPIYKVDSVDKVRTINGNTLQYIVRHPEQLRETSSHTIISRNGRNMMPQKTLSMVNEYCFDISENQIVLGFLQYLIDQVQSKIRKLNSAVSNKLQLKVKQEVKANYILSSDIIQQYLFLAFQEYEDELKKIGRQLSDLLIQYKGILKCSSTIIKQVPNPTPIFMGIFHYRNIFTSIHHWFNKGECDVPSQNMLLYFNSADIIYEYYCLISIYDVLVSLGFEEDYSKRKAYEYAVDYDKYSSRKEENTFYFYKEDIELVLYYQPVVYSEENSTRNNISLFRTDFGFYTPDFILKKTKNGVSTYAILDAKWRNKKVLLDKKTSDGFRDLVYKYIYSISDSNTLKSVDYLWLLQGKDSNGYDPTYYNRSGRISKDAPDTYRKSSGVVRVTPKSGILELTSILKTFIL